MMKKILIVDDNDTNLYLLKTLLEEEGFTVAAAKNGQEALDMTYADFPDMIVSDILMPVMDGYLLCRKCKEDEQLRRIPFIFYTATYTEPKDEKFALSLGADRFVIKPQEPDILMAVLEEVWAERAGEEPAAPEPLGEEMAFFRQYNEVLFKKLEKKMLDLETANRRLASLEEQYRLSFENVTDIVWTIDADFNVQKMSPSVEKMLGYERQDFIGRSVSDLAKMLAPESMERAMAEISLVLSGQTIPASVYALIARDGTVKHGEISGSPILRNGGIVGVVFVVRDITERKQAERENASLQAQLQQAQKMEAIGTLAGGIAHDFNNILSAIIGYTELAMDEENKEKKQRYLKESLKGSERAKELVRQILTFSRQGSHEKTLLDSKALSKEAIKLIRASIPATIEIRQQFCPETCNIIADPVQIHQVIMNLSTNSAYAMKQKGGVLTVELSPVELPVAEIPHYPDLKPGPYVRITVSDTGCGIEPANIERIFEPFFTTKPRDEGTGLGLSVVYGIVKNHEGAIHVYSSPGQGTCFNIYLPRASNETIGEEVAPETVAGGAERVLFVDDEPDLVDISKSVLSSLGYQVTGTTSSSEALELFRAEPEHFDLVITDMTLPGLTGIDLSRKILQIRPNIPIILCSGMRESSTEEQAGSLGIKAYCMKPLTMKNLAGIVRKALDS